MEVLTEADVQRIGARNREAVGPVVAYGPPCAFEPDVATLLVGEAPNRWMGSDPERARHVLFRDDLHDLCDVTGIQFYRCFARCNLLDRWPGSSGKGSSFPLAEARVVADALLPELEERFRRVVLVGRRVASAFGPGPATQPWFLWSDCTEFELAVVPHPSRVSRWWDVPGNVDQARAFWSKLAREQLLRLDAVRAERKRLTAATADE